MPDDPRRDPWDLSRLGDEDFADEPLGAPKQPPELDDDYFDASGSPRPMGEGRRFTPEERAAWRRRGKERKQIRPEYFGQPSKKRHWPRWGGVAVILVIIIIAGNWRLLGGGGGDPSPTPEPTPTLTAEAIAAIPSPTATLPVTPTPEFTATSTPQPTPTSEPTPDPRFANEMICLDPGHGGSDRGYTRGNTGGVPAMEEAVENLLIATEVQARLESLGFTVVMTRTTDTDVNPIGTDANGDGQTGDPASTDEAIRRAADLDELQARINFCNEANADLLISMHFNGYPDPAVSGFETWFSSARPFDGQNHLIAALIFDELGKQYSAAGYTVNARQVNDDVSANVGELDVFDRYIITGPDQPGAINASEMPGTIVEALFVSNDRDASVLTSEQGRNAIVQAYENGVLEYFNIILGPAESSDGA